MRNAERVSRRIKLRQLNTLVAVVEAGSMAKAAQALAISQPVVSKAIAELEGMLGLQLLERGSRGVEPTVYGRALLKRSVAILDELRTSVDELEFLADPSVGELRIGATEAMAAGLLPRIVDRMARQYPRVMFEIVLGDPAVLRERELRGRRIDLLVGQRTSTDEADDFVTTQIYRDRICVVAGMTSPWARRRRVALADLVDERWCLPPPTHPVGKIVYDAFRNDGLASPRSVVTVTSAPTAARLVAMGQFLAGLGSLFLHLRQPGEILKILPVSLPAAEQSVGVVMLKGRTPSPVAMRFIECAQAVARPLSTKHG